MNKNEYIIMKYITITFAICFTSAYDGTYQTHTSIINKTIIALNRTVEYASKHYKELNLDGIFGLRTGDAILTHMLKNHRTEIAKTPEFLQSIEQISTLIHKIGNAAVKILETRNTAYWRTFKSIYEKIWYYHATPKHYREQLVWKVNSGLTLSEKQSDKCMSQILGTQKNGVQRKCQITDWCWKMFTTPGSKGYYLTHQAIYFVLADHVGCRQIISEFLPPFKTLDDVYEVYGSNILSQMRNLMRHAPLNQDLFFEQTMVCNWLGIDSCNQVNWLERSLGWQDKTGCITNEEQSDEGGATLRDDIILKGGCSSHATGLYIHYLAVNLQALFTHTILS